MDIGMLGVTLAVVALAGLALLLPLSAYAAQKWAYKTYLETRSVNAKLARILELLQADTATGSPTEPTPAPGKQAGKRREPTLGNTDI
jgi:hypothetical protein